MNVPPWWLFFSGLFFALGSIVLLAMTFVALQMIASLRELSKTVKDLQSRVDTLSTRVGDLVSEARTVTGKVGGQATGLLTNVNSIISGASSRLETLSVVLLVIGMIRNFLGLRRRQKGLPPPPGD